MTRTGSSEVLAAGRGRIVFLVSEDWWFCMHWLDLAQRLQASGYAITVICNVGSERARIEEAGFQVLPLDLDRAGVTPFADLAVLRRLIGWLRELRPALVHCIGIKPILLGTVAARRIGDTAILCHFAGLGYLFSSRRLKARLLRPVAMLLMRAAFAGRSVQVVTMNTADRDALGRWGLVDARSVRVIPGNGLGLEEFPVLPEPGDGALTIAIVARMIEDKGISVLLAAFARLRERLPDCELLLVGRPDASNPTAIPERRLAEWGQRAGVSWIPYVESVREVWARAHIAVLPSRREGLPVTLLEAAACGRPLVATDVPGCREIVLPGQTGLRVPVGDVAALASALEALATSAPLRRQYGAAARRLVEERYSVEVVSAEMIQLYRRLIVRRAPGEVDLTDERSVPGGDGSR